MNSRFSLYLLSLLKGPTLPGLHLELRVRQKFTRAVFVAQMEIA